MARRRQRNAPRDYPRTARLNELLREVIADQIERIDDDELGFVSVTSIEVDSELTLAKVYVSFLDEDIDGQLAVLSTHRGAIRKALGSQARLRRTPDLRFLADPSVQTGGRIEEILAELDLGAGGDPEDGDPSAAAGADADGVADPGDG